MGRWIISHCWNILPHLYHRAICHFEKKIVLICISNSNFHNPLLFLSLSLVVLPSSSSPHHPLLRSELLQNRAEQRGDVHPLHSQAVRPASESTELHRYAKRNDPNNAVCVSVEADTVPNVCSISWLCVAEASYTLLLYDELLEWSDRPLREFLNYPMQSEWQRKEYLHLTIVQNFDRGKVSLNTNHGIFWGGKNLITVATLSQTKVETEEKRKVGINNLISSIAQQLLFDQVKWIANYFDDRLIVHK